MLDMIGCPGVMGQNAVQSVSYFQLLGLLLLLFESGELQGESDFDASGVTSPTSSRSFPTKQLLEPLTTSEASSFHELPDKLLLGTRARDHPIQLSEIEQLVRESELLDIFFGKRKCFWGTLV